MGLVPYSGEYMESYVGNQAVRRWKVMWAIRP